MRVIRRVGPVVVALGLLPVASACRSNAHRAKVLDVQLGVDVHDVRLEPPKMQPSKMRHPVTLLDIDVTISNPADQHVWASDCQGRAYDAAGRLAYVFSFQPGYPAGELIDAKRTWTGRATGSARVSNALAATVDHATAACKALDWGDTPPG
jgi:hypothetical protein